MLLLDDTTFAPATTHPLVTLVAWDLSCNTMQSLQTTGARKAMRALPQSEDDSRYPAPPKEMTAKGRLEALQHISEYIKTFSHLWHVRQTLLRPENARAPVPADLGERIISSLHGFAEALFTFQTNNREGPRHDLEQVLLSTGVADVLYDVILSEGFLEEAWWFISTIFHGLMTVVLNVQKFDCYKVGAQLVRRTPGLWKHLWDHRVHLRLNTSPPRRRQKDVPSEPLLLLLALLNNSGLKGLCGPNRDSPAAQPMPHVAQVSAYIWISLTGFMQLSDPDAQVVQSLVITVGDGLTDDVRDEIVDTLILNGYGADAFFERFKRQIDVVYGIVSDPSPADSDRLAFLELSALRSFASSPLLRPYFDKHRTYEVFIRTLAPTLCTGSNVRDCISGWLACGDLTAVSYSISFPRGVRALCSLNDAFYLLSRAVDLLAQHGSTLQAYDAQTSLDETKKFELTLTLSIQVYCNNVARWSRGELPEHTAQDVEQMKVAARVDWWPSLRALQTAKYRAMRTPQRKYYDGVLGVWTELGLALGLDAEKERKSHVRETAHRCTWFACPNHRSTPDMGTLKACKGCGEVRYCGRDCQKRDWSKGGHREKCRRLT